MTYRNFATGILTIFVVLGVASLWKSFTQPEGKLSAATSTAYVSSSSAPSIDVQEAPSPAAIAAAQPSAAPQSPSAVETTPTTSTATQEANASNVTLIIDGRKYAAYAPANATVVDVMRTLASSTDLTFTDHEYSGLGTFIDSINGKKNADGMYWFLYLNGKSADTGASQTTLHAGDTVEWRFKKSD